MGIRKWSWGLGEGLGWLWVFPAIGALLLLVALVVWQARQRFEARALQAEGEVVSLQRQTSRDSSGDSSNTYCPVVVYRTADGRKVEFTGSTCAQPPSYAAGERVRVLYEADAPQRARLDGFAERWLAVLVVGGIGGIFTLIGAGLVLPRLISSRRAQRLYRSGRPVQARIVDVVKNHSLNVNGAHPWQILVQWQDPMSQQMHVFRSRNLWYDPSPHLTGDTLRVFIDPQRPQHHVVDTRSLPESA